MAASSDNDRRVRLSIDVEPELKRRLKIAAARQDLSIRDYVEVLLRRALEEDEEPTDAPASSYYPPAGPPSLNRQSGMDRTYWET
jgi:hypothetical protein